MANMNPHELRNQLERVAEEVSRKLPGMLATAQPFFIRDSLTGPDKNVGRVVKVTPDIVNAALHAKNDSVKTPNCVSVVEPMVVVVIAPAEGQVEDLERTNVAPEVAIGADVALRALEQGAGKKRQGRRSTAAQLIQERRELILERRISITAGVERKRDQVKARIRAVRGSFLTAVHRRIVGAVNPDSGHGYSRC